MYGPPNIRWAQPARTPCLAPCPPPQGIPMRSSCPSMRPWLLVPHVSTSRNPSRWAGMTATPPPGKPSDNGTIVQLLGTDSAGRALLDVDGSGQAADTGTLSTLGISDAERVQLATLYPVGRSMWRVAITHFTPY